MLNPQFHVQYHPLLHIHIFLIFYAPYSLVESYMCLSCAFCGLFSFSVCLFPFMVHYRSFVSFFTFWSFYIHLQLASLLLQVFLPVNMGKVPGWWTNCFFFLAHPHIAFGILSIVIHFWRTHWIYFVLCALSLNQNWLPVVLLYTCMST